jgi:2-polyprenyl-6-methoxyphenol hydroxylase-like FAD-dependent oxidoreductase
VLIVGGGIAGSSLAYALASAGLSVTVLESSVEYLDRVRGESMMPWGVKEARNLGVEQTLLDAGAHVAPAWLQYHEGLEEPAMLPMSMMVEGIPGALNLRHPDACQALIDAAAAAGATVVRGVHDVQLRAGQPVSVTYSSDRAGEALARLVVGADGRSSTVRRQAGISLQRDDPMNYISGLLVDGLAGIPDNHDVMVGEGDELFLMFHQGDGPGPAVHVPGPVRPAPLRRARRCCTVHGGVETRLVPAVRNAGRGDSRRALCHLSGR